MCAFIAELTAGIRGCNHCIAPLQWQPYSGNHCAPNRRIPRARATTRLTYHIPANVNDHVERGTRACTRVRHRKVTGEGARCVWGSAAGLGCWVPRRARLRAITKSWRIGANGVTGFGRDCNSWIAVAIDRLHILGCRRKDESADAHARDCESDQLILQVARFVVFGEVGLALRWLPCHRMIATQSMILQLALLVNGRRPTESPSSNFALPKVTAAPATLALPRR